MKILGVDPASTTGWALIEDGDLVDYGSIAVTSKMTLPQKLNFISQQYEMLLNRLNPDLIAIEEQIMASSGIKILRYLARVGGVYILESYKRIQEAVELYEPSYWKAHSVPGIVGGSPKWKIQLEVVRFFGKVDDSKIYQFESFIESEKEVVGETKKEFLENREKVARYKKSISRKRNPLSEEELEDTKQRLRYAEKTVVRLKKEYKCVDKKSESNLSKICTDIYSLTGISSDIADAVGIAYCRYLKTIK